MTYPESGIGRDGRSILKGQSGAPQYPGASVGRIVHYYRQFPALVPEKEREPQAAIITRVHGEGMVELEVFGMGDKTVHRTVPFSATPVSGTWTWPPRV